MLENPNLAKEFNFSLKYTHKNYRDLFELIQINSSKTITSDLDYQIPMEKMGFQTTMIPNPVNIEKIQFQPLEISGKNYYIFGYKRRKQYKKRDRLF